MGLRGTFDEDPEVYDRARPGYPEEVFEDLTTLARLRPGSRILELGCGTGQATIPLATRGFEVVAIELGPGLAKVARRNLAAFPAVEVVNAAFEQWPLPPVPFDVVVAATSFHWLDPEVRLHKVADALRPGAAWRSSPPTTSPAATTRSSPRCSAATRRGCRARRRAFGSRTPATCPT
jgi:SAM-dependent methyltransferase